VGQFGERKNMYKQSDEIMIRFDPHGIVI